MGIDGQVTGNVPMVDALAEIARNTAIESPYLGTKETSKLKQMVDTLEKNATGRNNCFLYLSAGEAHVRQGDLKNGIKYLTRSYELMPTAQLSVLQSSYIQFALGVAYLRLGETENCCAKNTPESCIIPIRGGGIHSKVTGSTKAIQYFEKVLRAESLAGKPHEGFNIYLASRWLLNVAYMTLDGYPDKVSPEFLIPTQNFQSEVDDFPRFENIAQKLGLNTFNLCGGAIVDDFNNDGYLDIITSTWDLNGQIRFFANDADGTFSERTKEAGLLGLVGGLNIEQTDYNNDGNLDILVLRGGWLSGAGKHPNSLICNNGDGTFTDVTFASGLGDVHFPTQTGAWSDYDNDGDLDLFVGNEHSPNLNAPCQLFRNNGNGTFTDVAAKAGVHNFGYTKGTTWGDYDGDQLPDLYVSNHFSPNRLYRNQGNGIFSDVAPQLGVDKPIKSFPTWFWDYDNDGTLDLFVSSYTGGVDHLAAHYLGQTTDYERARLYQGDGKGGFNNVTQQQGLEFPMLPMGSNFGDLNNDGYLDFYLGTGDPEYHSLMPNQMLINKQGKGFTNVTMAGGFGHLQKGHGIVFADFDNDGDVDVFEQMGGAYKGDEYGDALFENPGFNNHWIVIRLIGVSSNSAAIGARIHIEVEEAGSFRSIYKHINSGGSFGANPLRQTIGMGKADQVHKLSIFWPKTGHTQTFHNFAANQSIQIVEDEKIFTKIDLKELSLGGQ